MPADCAAPSFELFQSLFTAGDLPEAERVGQSLLAGLPGRRVDILTHIGLLRRRNGLPGPAVEAFLAAQQAAGAARTLPEWFHSELAGAYVELRAWPLALEAAEAGLEFKPALGLMAATALVHLGQPAAAGSQLRRAVRALAHDPSRATAAAAVCVALLAVDQSAVAQAVAAEAAAAWAGSAAFAELRATLALLREDWSDAAIRYAQLIDTPAGAPIAALQRLNEVLRRVPAGSDAFAPVFEAAVLAAPDSEPVLFQWRDFLAATLSGAEVTARYAGLQARSQALVPALMLQLARHMPHGVLLERFADQIEAWRQSDAALACQAYLDALCAFEDPGKEVIARALAVPSLRMRLFFLLRQPRLRAVQVRDPTPEQEGWLREAGVDAAAVQAFLGDLVGPLSPEWDAYLGHAAFSSPDAEQIVRLDEGFTAFQDRIVRDQEFRMVDPNSGGASDLFDSVKIHDRQVFSFRGTELVTFHAAGNMNFAVFLHLVRSNLLLLVDTKAAPSKQGFYSADHYVAEIQAIWLRRAAQNHAALLRSASMARAARGTRRRIAAIHGRAENPAHHIWNYLPPFERLALAGVIGNIGMVVPPPTLYFGPIAGLFPELAGVECRAMAEAAVIDPCPFSPHDIALQLGGSFIPKPLLQRVQRWAERQAPTERRAEIGRLSQRRPVIWIGLRVGDKVWVDQTAGLARMIDLVTPLYPEALFVLDGFSLPDCETAAPEKWHGAMQALQAVAAAVRSQTAFPDAVHSLVGNRLSESVLWAQAAHAYFTPLGSSQHKVGWHGAAPGLVYTSSVLAKTPAARRQGSWEAEGSAVPDFLIGEIVAPGQRRSNYDYRSNLENIGFPAHVAARRLLAVLGAAGAIRSFAADEASYTAGVALPVGGGDLG